MNFAEMRRLGKTQCFFCGKDTTEMVKECDNPECTEKYRKVKEEKKHPFFV